MSIGEVLAAARHRSGLTVGDVGKGTRIRESIIRGIERDDYSACGGDFYARGHIRAIAKAVDTDPRPLIEEYDATVRARELAAPTIFAPAVPVRIRERRGINWSLVLGLLVLIAVGLAAYLFVAGSGHPASAGTPRQSVQSGHGKRHSPGHSPGSAGPPPAALTPVSAVAFGPGGAGTGDDSQDAALAIDGNAATAWHTDWYASAQFGGLQQGTGLLIDLGGQATITSVRITLGSVRGADLQLRAGNSARFGDLRAVATATGTGGSVPLTLSSPVSARYLLVWFTKLPPDSSGTYLESVYDIKIDGRR